MAPTDHSRCQICHTKQPEKCNCPAVCKNCLTDAKPQVECTCCERCKKRHDQCSCPESAPGASRQAEGGDPQPQQIIYHNYTPVQQFKPPDISMLKEKTNLSVYLHAQDQWVRLSSTPKSDQADIVMWHAAQTFPELYKEMIKKFGSSLVNKKDGMIKLTAFFKERFGLDRTADLMATFRAYMAIHRKKNQDLISFIREVEEAYSELEKLGESLSPNFQATFLLDRALLSINELQIISSKVTLNEPEDSENTKPLEDMKAALRKHQQVYSAAGTSKQQPQQSSGTKTQLALLSYVDNEDSDAELELDDNDLSPESIKTFLSSIKKNSAMSGKSENTEKRIWKCSICLCDCLPKWKPCEHPCSNHRHWQCPMFDKSKHGKVNKDKNTSKFNKRKATFNDGDKTGKKKENSYLTFASEATKRMNISASEGEDSFIVKKEEALDTFQPLAALFQALESQENFELDNEKDTTIPTSGSPSAPPDNNYGSKARHPSGGASLTGQSIDNFITDSNSGPSHVDDPHLHLEPVCEDVFYARGDEEDEQREVFKMLIDTGSPSTIISVDKFALIKKAFPKEAQSQLKYEESNKQFQFGGGKKTLAMGSVKIPVWLMDEDQDNHVVFVRVDIVQQKGIPLLLGANSLIKVKASLNLGKMSLEFRLRRKRTVFPVHQVNSGHIMLPFVTLSEEDDRNAWSQYMLAQDWDNSETKQIIHYVTSTESPDREDIVQEVFITNSDPEDRTPLTKKQVFKLHHFFGHVNKEHLRKVIIRAGRYSKETKEAVDALASCEVCKLEASRIPRPKVSLPRAVNFNHLLCVDLKENKRYPAEGPYILYLIDGFTRFKLGRFISGKKGDTVTNAIYLEWFKLFGPPKFLQSDRGREFMCKELKEMCQLHDVKYTTSPSYSANSNGLCERGHYTVDKMMHRMITADPKISPQAALAFSLHAANTLYLTKEGITPHTLVFGRNPVHPSLHDYSPGNNLEDDNKSQFYRQFKAMLAAREAFVAVEADRTLREALQSRVFANAATVEKGDWIWFKRNIDRKFQGPVKVIARDGKRLHCLSHGQNVVVNLDDVLLHKAEQELGIIGEEFTTIPTSGSPSAPPDNNYGNKARHPSGGASLTGQSIDNIITDSNSGPSHVDDPHLHLDTDVTVPPVQAPHTETVPPPADTTADNTTIPENTTPATSTAPDIGIPVVCNMCQEEISSKLVQSHCESAHDALNVNIRKVAVAVEPQPDSIYQNLDKLKEGVALAQPKSGKYYVLKQKITDNVWQAEDVGDKTVHNLDILNDMTSMRFIGEFVTEEEDGLSVNNDGQRVHYTRESFQQKIFFTSENNFEPEVTYVVTIPRSQHGTRECREAKDKELNDFETFDVYEEVNATEVKSENIVKTEWVLVRKEQDDGSSKVKARLCLRGDQEILKHQIPRDSSTINKVTLKIFLTVAASLGWDMDSSDVRRAFLQTEPIQREVYCIPPAEANVQKGKIWRILRSCYGLIDASRAFYLRYMRELKSLDFIPLKMDPAGIYHKTNGKLDAVYGLHVDDAVAAGERTVLDKTHNEMEKRFEYGERKSLPYRFLGLNYARLPDGDIQVDQDHYFNDLEEPDISNLNAMAKQDLLSDFWQTKFRSLASKLNLVSLCTRPDIVFQAKYLTTRYGKATKSDVISAIKLIRTIKKDSSAYVIPSLGSDLKDWILVGCADASNRSKNTIYSTGGQVVMLTNRVTGKTSVLNWTSRRLSRVVHSSLGAECLSLQSLTSQLYFVRSILEELFGDEAKEIPTLAYTDCSDLFSAVHNIKNVADARLAADIISIKEAIQLDQTITELRFCHGSDMLADSLTKYKKLGNDLWNVMRTGSYSLPGGSHIRDSTKTAVKTWHQLMQAEAQAEVTEVD